LAGAIFINARRPAFSECRTIRPEPTAAHFRGLRVIRTCDRCRGSIWPPPLHGKKASSNASPNNLLEAEFALVALNKLPNSLYDHFSLFVGDHPVIVHDRISLLPEGGIVDAQFLLEQRDDT